MITRIKSFANVIPSVVACTFVALMLSSCAETNLVTKAPPPALAPPPQVRVWLVKPANQELTLVPVWRDLTSEDKLKSAVQELLKGPEDKEAAQGLGSEIPRGTILIGINSKGKSVELNLSRRFAQGGGIASIQTRIDQLAKTVADNSPDKKVYLSVEGQRLETAGGEGIEVKQPLN